MKKNIKTISAFLLLTSLVTATVFPIRVKAAENQIYEDEIIYVDEAGPSTVHGLSIGYGNNSYVSMSDLSILLSDTNAAFKMIISSSSIYILSDGADLEKTPEDYIAKFEDYSKADYEPSGWTTEEKSSYSKQAQGMNELYINGEQRKYYTTISTVSNHKDAFISFTDFCLLMDIEATHEAPNTVYINTTAPMSAVNPAKLEAYGFFDNVNGLLVGDATTGEIYYGYNADTAYPIASTTKLMTFCLALEAIRSGQIGLDDYVTVSDSAVALSQSVDGVTPMKSGQRISVKELIYGAMLPSSNECALTLGEYIAGSEEAFVEMMNKKASDLGITTAVFHNPHGLPVYSDDLIPAKMQNEMSPIDMFVLTSYILNTFPEAKSVTSTKEYHLDELGKDIKNTNGLLYNMPEVNGLKTGTTNKSGACLVSSLTVSDGSLDHDIIIVLLGAENSQDRIQVSELMAHYAKAVVKGEASPSSISSSQEDISTSTPNAEAIVNLIVNSIIKARNE